MDQIALLYTTWPDAETAERVAELAIEGRLAACVNVLATGTSIYRWKGKLERTAETVAIFKTTGAQATALSHLIVDQHPSETPAVLALTVETAGSNPAFLAWVGENAR